MDIVGTKQDAKQGAIITSVFVNTSTLEVLFVEHASLVREPDTSSNAARLAVSIVDGAPVWRGTFKRTGDLVPDKNYPDVKALRSMKQLFSCSSKVGKVCDFAAAGDSILACAVLVETGPGAVACGFALLIISIYGCGKLQRMICG